MPLINRILDLDTPPLIVAELSGNHGQNIETAKQIIAAAAEAGADAIKLQTYTPDSITLDSDREEFVVQGGLWHGRRLYELYGEACTPYHWHTPLAEYARSLGIEIFSTPFDESAVDFLEDAIHPELYKISSFELTHIPLLKRVAETGKPVVLSSGMATEAEIEEAVSTLRDNGCPETVLLKCVSAYPSEPKGFNLRSMKSIGQRFNCLTGLSDHTLTNEIAVASVALGARLIEKHVTDSRAAGGIDAGFSLEPHELENLVIQTRRAHAALGSPSIGSSEQDQKQTHFRRSIYACQNIATGDVFTKKNLRIVRPSLGLPPKHWEDILGASATRDIPTGTPLSEEDLPH
ncbi:pseudaminic acid synthase [Pelagicoccus sp. SDUM812002]|uniref:pseudaminic acid synthase n=1 Tax=Pelagicoccus sp. SDUM812002 TaxID=3041266 RepID=UPI00281037EB|nr:pseudaminic acid synthase [Pelagicoccus sp. SDUM812002]MDQ8186169.1 pseudaminic acid synthase [Pelagicoccus sp. SDUM812002]